MRGTATTLNSAAGSCRLPAGLRFSCRQLYAPPAMGPAAGPPTHLGRVRSPARGGGRGNHYSHLQGGRVRHSVPCSDAGLRCWAVRRPCLSSARPPARCCRNGAAWCVHPALPALETIRLPHSPSPAPHSPAPGGPAAASWRRSEPSDRPTAPPWRPAVASGAAVEVKWAPGQRLKCCSRVDVFPSPDQHFILTKRKCGPFCDSQQGPGKQRCAGPPSTHH